MDYEKIKQLMNDMENSKLTSLDIDFPDGTKIRMTKEIKKEIISNVQENEVQISNQVPINNTLNTNIEKNKPDNRKIVSSPMVGTFYTKPSPTAEAYVEIGKKVEKGDVLCIIEAMKLMNEIESELSGEVVEVFVKDGEPVEYGQPLFAIA